MTNLPRTCSFQAVRLFSQTPYRAQTDDKELEKAQRLAEKEMDKQIAEDARQDVEESVAQTEADIQEAMQEVSAQEPPQEMVHAAQEAVQETSQKGVQENVNAAVQETPQQPPETDEKIARSAFIRNIVFEITEEHLKKAFEKYGPVEEALVVRDPRGLSKGYGFVVFKTPEALQEACANVNGSFWHGRRITCIPRQKGTKKVKHQEPTPPTAQLFIGNIPYETTDAELNRLFRGLENLLDVRVAVDRTTGWPRGFAHADFTSVDAAIAARAKLDGAVIANRKLRVDFAQGYIKKRKLPNTSE
ncbi:hypothetical protein VTK26DRAFT_1718 [Humicola hyalothermophila]